MKTTVVGSYPIPDWLKSLPNEQSMVDAMTIAIQEQLRAGIEVVSDGEVGRWNLARNAPGGMVERFVEPMAGIRWQLTRSQQATFESRDDMHYRQAPPGVVTGPVKEGDLNLVKEWRTARALTDAPLKFTVTSPYMLAKVVANDHYDSVEALAFAFADVIADQLCDIEADVLQVDEPNLPGSPEDSAIAAAAINRMTARTSSPVAIHLCFGNYGGQTIQRGSYAKLIEFLNALTCDHLVLETTRRPKDELNWLKEIDARLKLGLGVIDVKDLQIESADLVARRIETLSDLVGAERIAWIHPDCGLRNLPRTVAVAKLKALVTGRDRFCMSNQTSSNTYAP